MSMKKKNRINFPSAAAVIFSVAALAGCGEKISDLYEAGAQRLTGGDAEANAKGAGADTPLHKAAESGDLEKVKRLIADGADVNAKGRDGSAPLHAAADEPEIAKLLIESGANVNAKALDDDTPLHKSDELEAAILLLEHGADIHAKNKIGWTPMDWAIYEKNAEIQELLRSRGGRCAKLC